ncbi:hypothetical protein Xmau_00560 [Xenorhabdus mauleonii]|uniref:Uncharacterized protein n=1 Tax=Xenorhabdus mauleonii TaxID=351675 RepID=A0A1I3JBX8_9GAMM|nr:hypothetical protein [Xenorhabdus mauleonii]PHM46164.1 hypothetical protein Xmau_00560 [Xenorhabdus mauleonii]SFI57777.1 hypothetical protein SAMN05421680_102155 [Xenorhabdus mauleonii]
MRYSYIPDEFFSLPINEQYQRCARPFSVQYGGFLYFFDDPKEQKKRPRCNLIGFHPYSEPRIFRGGYPGYINAEDLSAQQLADICAAYLVWAFSIKSFRLLSSFSGATGFAQEFANAIGQPVKAATGEVYLYWSEQTPTTYNTHTFIEKEPKVGHQERNFNWYEPIGRRRFPEPNTYHFY